MGHDYLKISMISLVKSLIFGHEAGRRFILSATNCKKYLRNKMKTKNTALAEQFQNLTEKSQKRQK